MQKNYFSGKHNELGQFSDNISILSTEQHSEIKNIKASHKPASSSSSEKSSTEQIDLKHNQESSASESQFVYGAISSRLVSHNVVSPTTLKPALRRRNTTGPGMVFSAMDPPLENSSVIFSKSSPLQSPHLDKRFFDSSLIEIRSLASSSSTIDNECSDDIWIRRFKSSDEEKSQVMYKL